MKGAPLPPIDRSNTALVLHDMQNDFIKSSLSKPEMRDVVKRTKALIDRARVLPIPVIYTRVEYDPAMGLPAERAPYLRRSGAPICVKGTPGAEVIDELKPAAGDYVISKVRSSAFHETKLETLLRVKGVWILVVAGGSTNWGVEWLARDAKSRDLVTVALRDCTYSATPEAQAASLANIDDFLGYVMNYDQVVEIFSKQR
ncbi:MAG TPA: isochorismatase family cysteine hydrolase [Candidatus Binatia bacterium]|nr:isochorismatase family cysteine hydrolase [Candidatus Binatia bacterium]